MFWVIGFLLCLVVKSEILTLIYMSIGLVAVLLKFIDQFEVDG